MIQAQGFNTYENKWIVLFLRGFQLHAEVFAQAAEAFHFSLRVCRSGRWAPL